MGRRFEYVTRVTSTGYEMKDPGFDLPKRSTKHSAGYDMFCPERVEIPPYKIGDNPVLVKTGVKAYMQDDEYLMLCNRSSNPGKKGLILANSVGIVDADYYGNPDNDGLIMYAFYNFFAEDVQIKKGDVIGQAIFKKYEIIDSDNASGERVGGFGSTSK